MAGRSSGLRPHLAAIVVLAGLLAPGKFAKAAIIDLGHPTLSPFLASNIGNNERTVAFDALSTFSIDSIGIRFDPLTGGATGITVTIRQVDLTGGVGTRGSVLASSTIPITDIGLSFYDVPIDFTFLAGNRYDVAFASTSSSGWGFLRNNMEFYRFDFPGSPYTVGGLVSVVDGGAFGTGAEGYPNSVMPHIRLNTRPQVVPEPSSLALLSLGMAGLLGSA